MKHESDIPILIFLIAVILVCCGLALIFCLPLTSSMYCGARMIKILDILFGVMIGTIGLLWFAIILVVIKELIK